MAEKKNSADAYKNSVKVSAGAARTAVKLLDLSPQVRLIVLLFAGIILFCLIAAPAATSSSQMDSVYYKTALGESEESRPDKENENAAVFEKETALNSTNRLLAIVKRAQERDKENLKNEIKRFCDRNGYDFEMSMSLYEEQNLTILTDGYNPAFSRLLAAFSVSMHNGEIRKAEDGYISMKEKVISFFFKKDSSVQADYEEALKKALDDFILGKTENLTEPGHFYKLSYEMEDDHIKVYSYTEIIHHESSYTDPVTGETVDDSWDEEIIHYYVHPVISELNTDEIAESVFGLKGGDPYENADDNRYNPMTVSEAINMISKGTDAVLYGALLDTNMFYFSGLEGDYEWPAPGNFTITSGFGMRFHPVKGTYLNHMGIDISVPSGSFVVAAEDGTVKETGYNSESGYFIKILHSDGNTTAYRHLSKIGMEKGSPVMRGQVIALSGNTGVSTGPHLHFEVINSKGIAINPLGFVKGE